MADTSQNTLQPEPEEAIETLLISRISAASQIPVVGMIAPASSGVVKTLTDDTFIGVSVGVDSQDGDYRYLSPFTFSVTVTAHVAQADDPSGELLRDECRRIRAVLLAMTGDGCAVFDSSSFQCGEFMLGKIVTDFVDGENPTRTKAYSATLIGRIINNNQ